MYPFFTAFALFALFTFVMMKRGSNNFNKNKEAFLEREREANSVRRQPIKDLKYVNLNLSDLPSVETTDEYLMERLDTLKVLSEEDNKIVNLSSYTNTDLKIAYGVANLPILTSYDQNFTSLCRCLYELGKRFYESGDIKTAKSYLEYGISIGTDLKSHYTLLADIYEQNMQYKEIVGLIHSAENINSALKGSLLRDLNNRLKDTNYSADEIQKPLEDISTEKNAVEPETMEE